MRNTYKILKAKSEERDHAENVGIGGRSNIKTAVKEVGCEDVDWIHLA
jgi:hypothetical protein